MLKKNIKMNSKKLPEYISREEAKVMMKRKNFCQKWDRVSQEQTG